MSDYQPDCWCVLKINAPNEVIYKVFASWSGGYSGSDSWKLNSGIVRATLVDQRWEFDGSSGSVYSCHKDSYGTNSYGGRVLSNLINKAQAQEIEITIMPENTAWDQLNYDPLQQWMASGTQ